MSAEVLGGVQLEKHDKTLRAFREGEIDVLVASDAMTHGMDAEGVRNVINYDMPAYIKRYIHCAGLTARAGQSGHCFNLLRRHEFAWVWKAFLKEIGFAGIVKICIEEKSVWNVIKMQKLLGELQALIPLKKYLSEVSVSLRHQKLMLEAVYFAV